MNELEKDSIFDGIFGDAASTIAVPTDIDWSSVDRWDPVIDQALTAYPDVPKPLMRSIIKQESNGNPNAEGVPTAHGTAKGMYQFIDSTAKQFIPGWTGPQDSYDPVKSSLGAAAYLSYLLKKNNGDTTEALKDYYGRGRHSTGPTEEGYAAEVQSRIGGGTATSAVLADGIDKDRIFADIFGYEPDLSTVEPAPTPMQPPPVVAAPPVEKPDIPQLPASAFGVKPAVSDATSTITDPLLKEKYRAVAEKEGAVEAGFKQAGAALMYAEDDPVAQARVEVHPAAATVGQIAGTLIPMVTGGAGAIKTALRVPKIASIANSGRAGKLAVNSVLRGSTAAYDFLARNNDKLLSGDPSVAAEAKKNMAINIAGAMASPAAEVFLPKTLIQPAAQAATDLLVSTLGQAAAGDNAFSKENLPNTVASAVANGLFGVADVQGLKPAALKVMGKAREVAGSLTTKRPTEIRATPEQLATAEQIAKAIPGVAFKQDYPGFTDPKTGKVAQEPLLMFNDEVTGSTKTIRPDEGVDALRAKIEEVRAQSKGGGADGLQGKTETPVAGMGAVERPLPDMTASDKTAAPMIPPTEDVGGPNKIAAPLVGTKEQPLPFSKTLGGKKFEYVRGDKIGDDFISYYKSRDAENETFEYTAVSDGEKIGHLTVLTDEGQPFCTDAFAVREDYRRRGIGTALLSLADKDGLPAGNKSSDVWTEQGEAAVNKYLSSKSAEERAAEEATTPTAEGAPNAGQEVPTEITMRPDVTALADKTVAPRIPPAEPGASATAEPAPADKITSMTPEPSPLTAGGLAAGQELPDKAANINLNRIGADYDAKRAIVETSADYAGKIDEARRGAITLETTRELANDLGMTETRLLKRRKGQAFNAEEALAARDLLNASANRIVSVKNDIMEKRKAGTLTDTDLVNFRLEMSKHAAIQAEVSGLTAEAGRALSSFRIASENRGNVDSAWDLLDKLGGERNTKRIIDKLDSFDDDDVWSISRFIGRTFTETIPEKVNRYFIESILSGPPTHIANLLSNTASNVYRMVLEKPFTIAADKAILGKESKRYFGEVPAEFTGMVRGFTPALKAAKSTLFTGRQQVGGPLETRPSTSTSKAAALLPTRWLSASDEFFKTLIVNGDLHAQAYNTAKNEGLSGEAMTKRMSELLAAPSQTMYDKAWKEAEYRTFTGKPGDLTRAISRVRDAVPLKLAHYVIPFLNTPMKIMKYGLERAPITAEIRFAYKGARGELTKEQMPEELGKIAFSHLMAIPVVLAAKAGNITGAGPQDRNERNALMSTGWQPYSIRIGDRYYSYARLEPVATILGFIADFTSLSAKELEGSNAKDLVNRIGYAISQNILNKTFFEQLGNVVKATEDPGQYGIKFINRLAGALIPNIVGKAADVADANVRQGNEILQVWQKRIPGLSTLLYPKRDVWGRPIEKGPSGPLAFVSPVRISKISTNKVDEEIRRLGVKISAPSNKVMRNGKSVEMSDLQYDNYSRDAGDLALRRVNQYINSERYKSDSDEDRKSMIRELVKSSRAAIRRRIKLTPEPEE